MPETEVKPEDKSVQEEVDALVEPEEVFDPPSLEDDPAPEPDKKVHPLHPGGVRFEQVYAKGKKAERDYLAEHDLRIAAEAKLEALTSKGTTNTVDATKEYEWPELEAFIAQGRITRADAQAHREEVVERRLLRKSEAAAAQKTQVATRSQFLTSNIQEYVQAVPAILTEGSPDRVRLDEEFDFIASVEGVDTSKIDDLTRKRLQLTALRTVYGSVDAITKRSKAVAQPDTHQGLPGGFKPPKSANPDQALLDKLTKEEVAHYNKMFRSGRYPNRWKDVVDELKFVPPARVRR